MKDERQRFPLLKAVEIGLIGAVLFLQFRLLTICIIAFITLCFIGLPRLRGTRWVLPAGIVVVASMLVPFDVAIGSFHYRSRRGTSSGGPHFVRLLSACRCTLKSSSATGNIFPGVARGRSYIRPKRSWYGTNQRKRVGPCRINVAGHSPRGIIYM
jgi:hypothetical protein